MSDLINKKPDIFELGEIMDAAIINLASDKSVNAITLQKGIFFYLLSLSRQEGYNFKEIADIIDFEPYKLGPFSDFVNGEIETLEGYGYIKVEKEKNSIRIMASQKGRDAYKLDKRQKDIIKNIKFLVENLDPMEITFYIYFNPDIYPDTDGDLRQYFISNSEIKDKLESKKEYYVRQLLKKKVIDENTANLILYGND